MGYSTQSLALFLFYDSVVDWALKGSQILFIKFIRYWSCFTQRSSYNYSCLLTWSLLAKKKILKLILPLDLTTILPLHNGLPRTEFIGQAFREVSQCMRRFQYDYLSEMNWPLPEMDRRLWQEIIVVLLLQENTFLERTLPLWGGGRWQRFERIEINVEMTKRRVLKGK